jgi:hypothetical protein
MQYQKYDLKKHDFHCTSQPVLAELAEFATNFDSFYAIKKYHDSTAIHSTTN